MSGTGNFFVVLVNFYGFACTIGRFGERFRNGQYSSVSFLFAARCPIPSHFLKWEGGMPRPSPS